MNEKKKKLYSLTINLSNLIFKMDARWRNSANDCIHLWTNFPQINFVNIWKSLSYHFS